MNHGPSMYTANQGSVQMVGHRSKTFRSLNFEPYLWNIGPDNLIDIEGGVGDNRPFKDTPVEHRRWIIVVPSNWDRICPEKHRRRETDGWQDGRISGREDRHRGRFDGRTH